MSAFPRKSTWGKTALKTNGQQRRILHFRRLARKNTFSKTAYDRIYNYNMISISKKLEYGLAFVLYLSKDREKLLSLRQVAGRMGLPYRFLGKIAVDLTAAGIVESKEGKKGGRNSF